jgi:serine/threonine protein kinase
MAEAETTLSAPHEASAGTTQSAANEASSVTGSGIDIEASEITEPPDEPTLLREQENARLREGAKDLLGVPASAKALSPGDTLGRYRLLRLLGEGGMGVVFEAFDPELERKVALKLISVSGNDESEDSTTSSHVAQARLILEAQAQAKLIHPNVVAVYDVGVASTGVYMAMELVEGQTIKQWLRSAPRHWKEVVSIYLQAANGLSAAHAVGLIHRDFKPDNLLLGFDGRVRVADFGLAMGHGPRQEATAGVLSSLFDTTQVGHGIAGTPSYMAPEQHRGAKITAHCDQFAFCVSLYEALLGGKPFRGAHRAELVSAIERQEFAPLQSKRSVPRWLRAIVVKGLSYDPAHRHASLQELVAQIEERMARRSTPLLAALFGVTFLAIGGLRLGEESRNFAEQCEIRALKAQDALSPQTFQEIESAFLATNLPFARDAASTVNRIVSDRIESWTSTFLETCLNSREIPSLSAPILECLDDQLNELSMLSRAYRSASAKDVQGAAQLVSSLSSADQCLMRSSRQEDRDRPRDPALLATYLSLSRDLRSLRTTTKFADPAAARRAALKILDDAKRSNIPALLGPAYSAQANLDADQLDNRAARKHSDMALVFAQASHEPTQRTEIVRNQLFLRGYRLGVEPFAEDIYRLGLAYSQREGNDPMVVAATCVASVPYLMFTGRGDQAESCLRGAVATYERNLGVRHGETLRAIEYLAVTISMRRVDAESLQLLLRARDNLVEVAGSMHPQLAMTNFNLATMALGQADYAANVQFLERGREIVESGGVEYALRLMLDLSLGDAHRMRGHGREAKKVFERCIEEAGQSRDSLALGPQISCSIARATIEIERGDYSLCEGALDFFEPLKTMRVSGLYGDQARLSAMGVLRDMVLACGNVEGAASIEAIRGPWDKAYFAALGTVRSAQDLYDVKYRAEAQGTAYIDQVLSQRIAGKLPQTSLEQRAELLELRWIWTRALLDLNRAKEALDLLVNDAPLRHESFASNEVSALIEAARIDALVQLVRPVHGLESFVSMVEAIDADDLSLEDNLYLAAIWARAELASRPNDARAQARLAQARRKASRLRRTSTTLRRVLAD